MLLFYKFWGEFYSLYSTSRRRDELNVKEAKYKACDLT